MTRRYRRIFAAALVASGVGGGVAAAHDGGVEGEAVVVGEAHALAHAGQGEAVAARSAVASLSGRAGVSARVAGPPESVGSWAAPVPLPDGVIGIHAVMLPTGKVLWFGTKINPSPLHNPNPPSSDPADAVASGPNGASAVVWDPAGGASGFTRVDPTDNIWCAGQSLLSDGSVLVTGGNFAYSGQGLDFRGAKTVATFDPFTQTWNSSHPDMRHGRWYPTQVLLDDAKTLITSGQDESGGNFVRNLDIDVFTPGASRSAAGTITNFPDARGGAGEPPNGGLYPHHFLMPNGEVLTAGPFVNDTWRLTAPKTNPTSWSDIVNLGLARVWGTGVLVPRQTPGTTRVMLIGGSDTTLPVPQNEGRATAEVFDDANRPAGWQPAAPLNVGRSHHNTVLLPDGSMVSVGGGVGIRNGDQWVGEPDQKQIELWDPATGQWTLGPAQVESRTYHSTAVLLPDGRVVSAGDDVNDSRGSGINRDTYEIYSPPYLFKGPRPTITYAPTEVRHNAPFSVASPDTDITRAVLMAPAATTHSNDMNQRHVPVTITRRSDGRGYDLTSPTGPTIAPPGYYMLFLLNTNGVPSTAKFIRIHPNAPDAPPIPAKLPPPDPQPPNPGTPGNTLPGAQIGSRVALGSFEAPKVAPWARRNAAVRVRGGAEGKYSFRLTGARRRPATLSRTLPTVAPGRYSLVFSVRDGRAAKIVRIGRTHEVRFAALRRGWRKLTVPLQVTAGAPPTVRFRMDPSRPVRIDNVYLIRVS